MMAVNCLLWPRIGVNRTYLLVACVSSASESTGGTYFGALVCTSGGDGKAPLYALTDSVLESSDVSIFSDSFATKTCLSTPLVVE